MRTAKFFEKNLERLQTNLEEQADEQPHPTIASLRAKPIDRSLNESEIVAREKRKQDFAKKMSAREARVSAQISKATAKKRLEDVRLKEKADPLLRLQNKRLQKHIQFLEDLLRKQAAEIAALKGP